jgi:hypothetical protein
MGRFSQLKRALLACLAIVASAQLVNPRKEADDETQQPRPAA